MEHQLHLPTADGGRKTDAEVVYEVLSTRTSSEPRFLQNVGVDFRPSGPTKRYLAAQLSKERKAKEELQDLVNIQRNQIE